MLGAAHGFEIPFVFGHFDLGKEGNVIFTEQNATGRSKLSSQMMSYWAQFAYSGAPGKGRDGRLPTWSAWDQAKDAAKFMVLDTDAGNGLRMSNEGVTQKSVLAALAADERLQAARDRCTVYHGLVDWSRGLSREEYDKLEVCRAYPFDLFPWS